MNEKSRVPRIKSAKAKSDAHLQLQCQSVAADSGYPVEAVTLILHVLSDSSPSPGKHLTATDICDRLLETAATAYGDRAADSLEGWNIGTSEDVGRIVMALAGAGLLRLAPGNSEADFKDLYSQDNLMQKLLQVEPEPNVRSAKGTQSIGKSNLIPRLVESHFQPQAVQELTITQRTWPYRVRVDLQRAIDQMLTKADVAHFSSVRKEYAHEGVSLHEIMVYSRHDNAIAVPTIYEEIDIGEESPARCLKNGFWLIKAGTGVQVSMAVLMAPSTVYGQLNGIKFEVAVPAVENSVSIVEEFFRALEKAILESKSYRGKVLSLEKSDHYRGQATGILVHRLRTVVRDQVILPGRTLELLDRNVIEFVNKRPQLSKLGMQRKKGLLFYGPPGTGKTHTIHYLAGALPEHTTLLITAEQVGMLPEFITLARLLQPSMVVIEDADLIARDRQHMHGLCEEVALNRLLNEMDGLREDADVIFILTTNRPESLEPALAARPGRIDQAIEFPLPDAVGRDKLIRLYSHRAALDDSTIQATVRKTEGVSAAFIKELMRRAAQFNLERDEQSNLHLADIDDALEEMLFAGGTLNRKLLGGMVEEATDADQ